MGYWVFLWILMAVAFGVAWLFIVKGCEMLDDKTMSDDPAADASRSGND